MAWPARRLYLENGDEIRHESQFLLSAPVYVSCGEKFEDPFAETRRITDKRRSTRWFKDGVHFQHDESPKKPQETRNITVSSKRLLALENGSEHNPMPIVFVQNSLNEFLEECSSRLKMSTSAKSVYNWLGERIHSLQDLPRLDKGLQTILNVEFAPVWVSRGEGFDARGALVFVQNLLATIKKTKKEHLAKQAELAKSQMDLSASTKVVQLQRLEMNETISQLKMSIKEHGDSIELLHSVLDQLKPMHASQIEQGTDALYSHIKEVDTADRIFGGESSKGVKLQVCLNGTKKCFKVRINNKDLKYFEQILNEIGSAYKRFDELNCFKFTRLFEENGKELTALSSFKLRNDQVVWVSTGDNWLDPKAGITYAVSMRFNMLTPVQMDSNEFKIYMEQLRPERVVKYAKSSDWNVLCESESLHSLQSLLSQKTYFSPIDQSTHKELNKLEFVLQCKHDRSILIQSQVAVNEMKMKTNPKDSVWDSDFQVWKLDKSGFICNSFFPTICLTLDPSVNMQVEINFAKAEPIVKTAYCVKLATKTHGPEQQWHLNKFGNIASKALEETMVLTSLSVLDNELNHWTNQKNLIQNYRLNCDQASLILLESFDQLVKEQDHKVYGRILKDLGRSQHWGIKQQGLEAVKNREWKKSTLTSAEGRRAAFTWPVDQNEALIQEFNWPIAGYLIPNAPVLKTLEEPAGNDTVRISVKIIRNGSVEQPTAICLTRDEMKENKEIEREFNIFLDKCTSVLSLPKVARRIFDETGVELVALTQLVTDQLIYVSMGEPWIPLRLVKEELERKQLQACLIEDLNKLAYFNKLKCCQNFVIKAHKMVVQEGNRLVLGQSFLDETQLDQVSQDEPPIEEKKTNKTK